MSVFPFWGFLYYDPELQIEEDRDAKADMEMRRQIRRARRTITPDSGFLRRARRTITPDSGSQDPGAGNTNQP
jgi:hypothetical protein